MHPALLTALGGGAISALLYLSVLTGSAGALILGYLAPLPLFLVGLSVGTIAAGIAGTAAALTVGLATFNLLVPVSYALTTVVPAVLLVRQALLSRAAPDGNTEWYPPGLLVMWVTGIGVAAFLGAVVVSMVAPGGLRGLIQGYLTAGLAEMVALSGGATVDPATLANAITPVFPAIVVDSWLVMTIVNGILAQGLLMRFKRNRRPPARVAGIELPHWAPLALATAGVVAMAVEGMAGFVALNVAIILTVPFFFAGLAVVHAFAQARHAGLPILLAVYFFMFLFGWPVLVVVGLGAIEQWIGLRRRFAATGPNQED